MDVRSRSIRFVILQRLSAFTVISHFFSAVSQRPLRLCVYSFVFARVAAMQQSRAVRAGTLDKNSCFAPQQSRAGLVSCSDNSLFPRVRTPDDAADILPARLRRQENRK